MWIIPIVLFFCFLLWTHKLVIFFSFITDRAFSAAVSYDVLLHESLHAFTYSTRNCPKNSTTLYRQDARDFFGGEEYLVDALVRYYGGAYNHYRTAGELDSSEQEYLTDYINICSA